MMSLLCRHYERADRLQKPTKPCTRFLRIICCWPRRNPDRPTYVRRPSILEYGSPPLMRTASDGAQLLSSTGRPPLPRRRSADDGDATEVCPSLCQMLTVAVILGEIQALSSFGMTA